jgi:hypothetical protein
MFRPSFRRLLLGFVRIAVLAVAVVDLAVDGGESPQALGPPRLVLISHPAKGAEGQFSERQRDTESTAFPHLVELAGYARKDISQSLSGFVPTGVYRCREGGE